jgi:hypothetical protein
MLKWIISVLTVFILISCELGGNKPLTCIHQSFIDSNVTGVWKYISSVNYNHFTQKTDSHYLYIAAFNKHEYLLTVIGLNDSDKNDAPMFFRAIVSHLKEKTVANVQPVSDKINNGYVYYSYKLSKDTLSFWGYYLDKVPENVVKHHQYKSFILKHFNDTSYFSSCRKYVRYKKNISFF